MATNDSTSIQLKLPLEDVIEIPLTQGQVAYIDAVDADLAQYKWFARFQSHYANGGEFHATRNTRLTGEKRATELMHRVILSRILDRPLLRSEIVDHKNRNPLDNRRENLRLATISQNSMNAGIRSDNDSGYKGVCWRKDKQKWEAYIKFNGKRQFLGYFGTPQSAHKAYCIAAKEMFGEFARLE